MSSSSHMAMSSFVIMNTNFELSRPLSPFTRSLRSAKLRSRSISRVSASTTTTNRQTHVPSNKNAAISVKPVYVPTPTNRELRTRHSGYHFDGTVRKFFEGWNFRVSIPEKERFCFLYSVLNPAFRKRLISFETALYGPRFTRVGAQILGGNVKYLYQLREESQNFWAELEITKDHLVVVVIGKFLQSLFKVLAF